MSEKNETKRNQPLSMAELLDSLPISDKPEPRPIIKPSSSALKTRKKSPFDCVLTHFMEKMGTQPESVASMVASKVFPTLWEFNSSFSTARSSMEKLRILMWYLDSWKFASSPKVSLLPADEEAEKSGNGDAWRMGVLLFPNKEKYRSKPLSRLMSIPAPNNPYTIETILTADGLRNLEAVTSASDTSKKLHFLINIMDSIHSTWSNIRRIWYKRVEVRFTSVGEDPLWRRMIPAISRDFFRNKVSYQAALDENRKQLGTLYTELASDKSLESELRKLRENFLEKISSMGKTKFFVHTRGKLYTRFQTILKTLEKAVALWTGVDYETFVQVIMPTICPSAIEAQIDAQRSSQMHLESNVELYKATFGWLDENVVQTNFTYGGGELSSVDAVLTNSFQDLSILGQPWVCHLDPQRGAVELPIQKKITWLYGNGSEATISLHIGERMKLRLGHTHAEYNWPFYTRTGLNDGEGSGKTVLKYLKAQIEECTKHHQRLCSNLVQDGTKQMVIYTHSIDGECLPVLPTSSSTCGKGPHIRGDYSTKYAEVDLKQTVTTSMGFASVDENLFFIAQDNILTIHSCEKTLNQSSAWYKISYDESCGKEWVSKQTSDSVVTEIIFPEYLNIQHVVSRGNFLAVDLVLNGSKTNAFCETIRSKCVNSPTEENSLASLTVLALFVLDIHEPGDKFSNRMIKLSKPSNAKNKDGKLYGAYLLLSNISNIILSHEITPGSKVWAIEDQMALYNLFIVQDGFSVYEVLFQGTRGEISWRYACQTPYPKNTSKPLYYNRVKQCGSYLLFLSTSSNLVSITPLRPRTYAERVQATNRTILNNILEKMILEVPEIDVLFARTKQSTTGVMDWKVEGPPHLVDVAMFGTLLAIGFSDGQVVILDLLAKSEEMTVGTFIPGITDEAEYVQYLYNKFATLSFTSPSHLEFFTHAGDGVSFRMPLKRGD